MWRTLRFTLPNSKVSVKCFRLQKSYSTSTSSRSTGKIILGIVASTGLGFAGAIVYGNYEPKFNSLLKEYVPFANRIYKIFSDDAIKSSIYQNDEFVKKKLKDTEKSTNTILLEKELDDKKASVSEIPKPAVKESKSNITEQSKNKHIKEPNLLKTELKATETAFKSCQIKEDATADKEAKTAVECDQLVETNKELFRKELQVVLSNYLQGDKTITESDLNLLIVDVHQQIEQLQGQKAKLQVDEKIRVDEAVKDQRMQDEMEAESTMQAEMQKFNLDFENPVEYRIALIKSKFEAELHQQLLRQTAVHLDHLQEAQHIQEQELKRKHVLELEEKLLQQKGVFISEITGNMARLKGVIEYLKSKSEYDEYSKKVQALWLACQTVNYKITQYKSGSLTPLAKDIAVLRTAIDEENGFINSVVGSIPTTSVNRGVYTTEILKQRFEKVKSVCKNVALVDENNDNLFRYILSYLQSFLIIDAVSIPKEELDGKVSVDTSEWDTFDILQRITYCLKINDLEQALRYANQLKGEPKAVAKDWMNEVKLLLETQLAVKALLAYASSVSVQAYH